MISKLPNKQIRDLSGGMVSNASDILLPDNVCSQSINFNYDTLGAATQRNGCTKLGATVSNGNTCTGIFQFIDQGNTLNQLVAGFGTQAFAYNGTTWSNVASGLDGTPIRMVSFLNQVIMVGGGDSTTSYSGSGSFGASSFVTGAPTGKYIETFINRVYIAGNASNPHRLFFSTGASTSGTITWNNTTQYLDINPEDTNVITGLKKISDLLLVFKKFSMYRWDGNATQAEIVNDIGTPSQESIVKAKGLVYFFSQDPLGIYVTSGGYPQEISKPVADWLQNMSASYYGSVSAMGDDDHYYCNIGSVTKDGRTYSNVWLVYTISSKNWAVFTFADSFRAMTRYITTAGAVTFVGGDTNGFVQTLLSGTTDNGSPIVYEYQSKQFEFDSRGTTKSIREFAAYVKNGAGATVAISDDNGPFQTIGEITKEINLFKGVNLQSSYFRVKIEGSNRQTPVVLNGFEFIAVNSLGYLTDN